MKAILIILVCVLWLPFSWSLEEDRTIQLRNIKEDFVQFGFARNGIISSLKVTTMPPQQNVSLYICTDKEYDLLDSYLDPDDLNFCSNPTSYCEYSGDHRVEVTNYRVVSKNRYRIFLDYNFVLVQCGSLEPTVKARLQYTLLNPGGQQLPLGEIPLPKLYIVVTCIWAILVGLCGVVWMRNKEHVVLLHGLLCSVAVFKLAVVIIALCYWHIYELTGEDIVQLKYLQSFIYALSETAFFCSLLLISKGWRITRSNLPPSEIRTISVALVLLLSTLLFFSFYNDGYYFLSLMIMYFFMLPKIFTSITRNTRALHTHMLLARYANVELNTIPILAKIRMFKTLRTAVILYLGSILIISSMKIIMWWFLEWVTSCVSEFVTIVMVVSVCLLTRPRLNGVFSPRSYFESGSFPVLNMQQFDHFDELFGDQIWDPDLVFGGNPNSNSNSPSLLPPIDLSEALVIEYPVPLLSKDISYFPRLAIATLEKEKKASDNNNNSDEQEKRNNNNNRMNLRRRTTSSSLSSFSSPSLANSTSALLPGSERSSLSLSSLSSNSPLLISPPSLPSFSDLDIELEVLDDNNDNNYNDKNKNINININNDNNDIELELRSISTQTSPPPTPTPTSTSPITTKTLINTKQNTKQNNNTTTTTTTTTTTSSTPPSAHSIESEKYNKDKQNTTVNNKPIKNTNINNDNNNNNNNNNKSTNCNTTTKHNNDNNNNNNNNKQRTKGNIPLCNSSSSLLAEGGEIEGEDELM